MKATKFLLISLFFLPSLNFAQNIVSNFVTGLKITQSQSNIISIDWSSDQDEATFSIYYQMNKPIIKDQDLKTSQFLSTTNMKGTQKGSLHKYHVDLMLASKGDYYFAVVLESTTSSKDGVIVPSLNSTIQPITIAQINSHYVQSVERQSYFENNGYTITSLNLEKENDFFRLRWFVYPKNLDCYIFTIYRSHYPIVNYKSPVGLPVYARVTNRFYFEDYNVSMETPYYYAVVPESNRQWQRGLNVLNEPGVLFKESPAFVAKPTAEYIRSKEQEPVFNIDEETLLSEEDIQRAVQQTLQKLQAPPTPPQSTTNTEDTNELPVEEVPYEPLSEEPTSADNEEVAQGDISTPKLGLSQVEREIAQFLEQSKQQLFLIRSRTLEKQLRAEQSFLSNESTQQKTLHQNISQIAHKVDQLNRMEERLLLAYKTPRDLLIKQLNSYYNHRDSIISDRRKIQAQIDIEKHKRRTRELQLRQELDNIASMEQKELATFLKNRMFHYQQKINFYKDRYDTVRTQKVADNIITRFHNINTNTVPTDVHPLKNNISSEISIEEMNYKQINDLSWTNDLLTQLPSMISSEQRVENLQKYSQSVSIEHVPSSEQLPKETWVSKKEIWKKQNREIWLEQNDIWREHIAQIIGQDRFRVFKEKWLKISSDLAAREAARAFYEGRFDESLFLHTYISNDKASILLLGRSFYELGAYEYAYSVFIVAYKMGIPESKSWLDLSAEKLLNRKIVQN